MKPKTPASLDSSGKYTRYPTAATPTTTTGANNERKARATMPMISRTLAISNNRSRESM